MAPGTWAETTANFSFHAELIAEAFARLYQAFFLTLTLNPSTFISPGRPGH